MTSGNSERLLLTAAVIAAAVCFVACRQQTKDKTRDSKTNSALWEQKRLQLYKDSIYPNAVHHIQTGDMVTRLGSDITSEMLRQLNQKDQSFSHCGIASIENDTVFVYHAIGGEFNPDEKVRRETLYSFGHPLENKSIGIFKAATNKVQDQKLLGIIQKAYKNEMKFDMQFDYRTDERQYCAEFVAKAYTRACGDSSWLVFSHRGGYSYVSVDNIFLSRFMVEKTRFTY